MAQWISAQTQVQFAKKSPTDASIMPSPTENPNPKMKIFFSILSWKACWIRRCFEQLSSSSGWRVTELQKVANSGQKSDPSGT